MNDIRRNLGRTIIRILRMFFDGRIRKYLRLSASPAVWCGPALKFYRHWSRPYLILSDNPGNNGRFSALPFSYAIAVLFPLSAVWWMEACRLLTALAGISGLIRKAQSRQSVLPGTVPCVLLCKTAGRRIYWQGTGWYNGSAHLISGAYLPYLLKPFWNWKQGSKPLKMNLPGKLLYHIHVIVYKQRS